MKIVVDLQAVQTDSRLRGIGRQARSLAFALLERAHRHDLFFVLNAALTKGLDEMRHELCRHLPADNVRLFDIPGEVRELEPRNLWRMRAAEIAREAFIAGLSPDVVHLTSLFEGVVDNAVTSIGLFDAPYPTVATLFDLIPLRHPQRYLPTEPLRQFYYRRAQSLKRASRIVAISEHVRREAIELLHVTPNIVDVAPLAAGEQFKQMTITPAHADTIRSRYGLPELFVLYVGAIEPRKNITTLVRGFSKLPTRFRISYRIVIAGRYEADYRLELLNIARQTGLSADSLIFPGHVAESDLPALYSLARLFVFPSEQEGFGLPPLEAMACGTPVLAARNSSLIEVIGREDMMFATQDPDQLAARMTLVFADPAHARSMADWGIERARGFNWHAHADAVLASLERSAAANKHARGDGVGSLCRRPRLAFVSPLPPARSGVADYALELLPELGCHYDVECVSESAISSSAWINANYPIRNVAYFRQNYRRYDRIVYAFGNSPYHAYMIDLLEEVPGVVMLHDLFLSALHYWMSYAGERDRSAYVDELYLTHGLSALKYVKDHSLQSSTLHYAVNRSVFDNALGVIVHSKWAAEEARQIYGDQVGQILSYLPLLKATMPARDKNLVRERLKIRQGSFVVCSFGIVADTKMSELIIAAWARSSAARREGAELLFIGEPPGTGPYRSLLDKSITEAGRDVKIRFTGYVDDDLYQEFLFSADLAVQLRTHSRGETSKAVLDCMAASVPLIVNAHGSLAEIVSGAALVIPDDCSIEQVSAAIDKLHDDSLFRASLASAARAVVDEDHRPDRVGRRLISAIEGYSTTGSRAARRLAFAAIANIYVAGSPHQSDIVMLAEAVTRNTPRVGPRRLLFDVTLLAQEDAHTGIERVVRAVLAEFIESAPAGYRVEPVRIDKGDLRFARGFLAEPLGLPKLGLPDTLVDYDRGDVYLTLEWAPEPLCDITDWLKAFRAAGGEVVIAIHDVLPLQHPHFFPSRIESVAWTWFSTVVAVATHLICFSRTTADAVAAYGEKLVTPDRPPLPISHVTLAADLESSLPTSGLPANAGRFSQITGDKVMFLMVGSVEPRKGHRQVIDAFHLLWANDVDVALVIVGRRGWAFDHEEQLFNQSAERDQRLFWFDQASDEWLINLYEKADALIAASYAEGFGLPMIEARHYGVPLIARDIPIFREVIGDDAFFFIAERAEELAAAIQRWLRRGADGDRVEAGQLSRRTWGDVALEIGDVARLPRPYRSIAPLSRQPYTHDG